MNELLTGIATIFMLHRVFPYEAGNLAPNENMKLSPEELESVILELKNDDVVFISLDELVEYTKGNKKANKRLIVFTLDDGYRDNLIYALPVFKKYQIPFCVYVTNGFPNRTTNLWWYALEKLILQNDSLLISGKRIDNLTTQQKEINFGFVRRQILDHNYQDPIGYLNLVGDLRFNLSDEQNDKCLSWAELAELSQDPLVTIGCHTVNHFPLRQLDAGEVYEEIMKSKEELELKTGKPVNHFAFPFGSKREVALKDYGVAKRIGFKTIVNTIHGHVHKGGDLNALGRIFLPPLKNNSTTLNKVMYWNMKTVVSFFRKVNLTNAE